MPLPTKRKMVAEDAGEASGNTAPTSFFHGQHGPFEEQAAIDGEFDVNSQIKWFKELDEEPGPSVEDSKSASAESNLARLMSYVPLTAHAPIQLLQPPVIKGPADCPVVGCNYSAAHCKNPSNSMNSHLINKGVKDEAHAEAKKSFTMKAFAKQVKLGLLPSEKLSPKMKFNQIYSPGTDLTEMNTLTWSQYPHSVPSAVLFESISGSVEGVATPLTGYNKAVHGSGSYDSEHREPDAGPLKKPKRARKFKANEAYSIAVIEEGEPSGSAIREDKLHEQAKAVEVKPYDDTLDAEGSDDEEYYASVEKIAKFEDIGSLVEDGGQQEADGGRDTKQAWKSTLNYRYHM